MDNLPINFTDLVVLLVLGLSALLAFSRGLVREVLSIGAWVGAALATVYGFPHAQPIARAQIEIALLADIVAGVAIFVVALILLTLLSHALSRNVRDSALGALDRSLGLIFGLLRGAVLVVLAYLLMAWAVPLEDRPSWIQEARTLPLIERGADMLLALLPESALSETRAAVEGAKATVDGAVEAGQALETLQNATDPAAPEGSGSAPAPAGSEAQDSAGGDDQSGYNDAERGDLERLLQGTQ